MILSAHQPAYLPWLGFFHKIAISDIFVILDKVQFEKNSFINRNKIKGPHGHIWLSIPLFTSGHTNKTISEMEIVNNQKWSQKHQKNLEYNYKKSPYYDNYRDYFKTLYSKEWKSLIDLLIETLEFFIKEMGIKTKIYRQSEIELHKKKQELILEMCEYFDAKMFVFGELGRNYADKSFFEKHNVNIYFQDYKHPNYPQLHGDFIPYLSIVDLLFNVGPENALEVIMKENISKSEICKMI